MSDTLTIEKILRAKKMLEASRPPEMPVWDGTILGNENLLITKMEELSLSERLLSWPWRPWKKHAARTYPDPNVYRVPYGGLVVGFRVKNQQERWVAHPVTVARLRADISKENRRTA